MACGEHNSRDQCCDLFPLGFFWGHLTSTLHQAYLKSPCTSEWFGMGWGENPIFCSINRVGEIKRMYVCNYT